MRLRPKGYFKRFQATIEIIWSSIISKVRTGKWLMGISRSRQNHWYQSLLKKISAYLTNTWQQDLIASFDFIVQSGQNPVSRSV